MHQKVHGLERVDRAEDRGRHPDIGQPQTAEHHKPDHHDRAEQLADAASAVFLDHE